MHYLPKKVIFCKLCVQSNQRPGPSPEHLKKNKSVPTIGFKEGICDACRYYSEIKSKINWKLERSLA